MCCAGSALAWQFPSRRGDALSVGCLLVHSFIHSFMGLLIQCLKRLIMDLVAASVDAAPKKSDGEVDRD